MSTSLGESVLSLTTDQSKFNKGLDDAHGRAKSVTGAIGGIFAKLSTVGLAAMGIRELANAASGLGEALGIGLNSEMENVQAQLMAFTKDGNMAKQVLSQIRAEADKTPFSFNAMAKATTGLIPAAKMANEPLMDLVKTAEVLAASNPAEGLEGAAFALREAVSGDFTSIVERFNLPRQYINQLKEEGVPALEIVRRAMLEMGYDADLVANLAGTLSGRWSTFTDTLDGIRKKVSQPIFDRLKSGLEAVQGWLDNNKDTIDTWVSFVTAGIDLVVEAITSMAHVFWQSLSSVADIVNDVGREIYEALSWLNPFATHSPSLVSQVKAGVDEIVNGYIGLGAIQAPLSDASDAVRAFAGNSKEALKSMVEASKDRLDTLKDALSAAKDELRRFTEAPIEGSKEFEDRLYAIEQQSTQVKLQLNQMKLAGVGKDALKPLEDTLDHLALQADTVRLEERLKLDPLRRQIKELTSDKGAEMPFAAIIDGITQAKDKIASLGPAVSAQERMLSAQQKAMQSVAEAAKGIGAASQPVKDISKLLGDTKQQADEWKQKVDAAKSSIQQNLSTIRGAFEQNIAQPLRDVFSGEVQVDAFITRIGDALLNRWRQIGDKWIELGQRFYEWIGPLIPPFLQQLGVFAASMFNWIVAQIPVIAAQLGAWANTMIDWAIKVAPPVLSALGDFATQLLGWIAAQAPVLIDKFLGEWLPAAIDWIEEAVRKLLPELGNLLSTVLTWLNAEAPTLTQRFIGEWVPAALGWVGQAALDVLPKLFELLAAIGKWIIEVGAPKLAEFAINMGLAIVQGILGGLAGLGGAIANAIGNAMPGGLQLPGFAHGGSFTVGGSGGIDSQLVAFMATPGEEVSISNGARAYGGDITLTIDGQVLARITREQLLRDKQGMTSLGLS